MHIYVIFWLFRKIPATSDVSKWGMGSGPLSHFQNMILEIFSKMLEHF